MKNNNLQKNKESLAITAIQKLEQISLSKMETDTMRENIRAYSDLHSIPTDSISAVPSPFAYGTSYIRTYSRAFAALGLVIVLLVGTTGVSYAAENTLPGQPLYAVKVSVVEPIQGALITDPVKKAEWQNELTQRRLTEAATLAAENNLSSSTQEYLAQAVTEHVQQSEADASQLSASGNTADALSVRSDLEARLSARANFLAFITPELAADGDSTTTEAISGLLATIQTDQEKVRESRIATEIALDGEATSTQATSTIDSTLAIASTATTTSAHKKALAYISAQDAERQQEEQALFQASSALFRLLPPLTGSSTASTTISTPSTISSVASSTDSTQLTSPDATTTPKYPSYRLRELKKTDSLETSGNI